MKIIKEYRIGDTIKGEDNCTILKPCFITRVEFKSNDMIVYHLTNSESRLRFIEVDMSFAAKMPPGLDVPSISSVGKWEHYIGERKSKRNSRIMSARMMLTERGKFLKKREKSEEELEIERQRVQQAPEVRNERIREMLNRIVAERVLRNEERG